MLQALLNAIRELSLTEQVSDQVTDQVRRLLGVLRGGKALKGRS